MRSCFAGELVGKEIWQSLYFLSLLLSLGFLVNSIRVTSQVTAFE